MARQFGDIREQLERWYQSRLGDYVYRRERELLAVPLDASRGHRLLQVGVSARHSLIDAARQSQKIYAAGAGPGTAHIATELEQLPFAGESIDILVLHHTLEFSSNPHQMLREANRVLAPGGELLCAGFNPWSAFGLACALSRVARRAPWAACRLLGKRRLRDWLRLLGLEVESFAHTLSAPPLGTGRAHRLLLGADGFATRHNWFSGGVYIVHARKQLGALTPDRLRWNRRVARSLIGLAHARPVPSPRGGELAA